MLDYGSASDHPRTANHPLALVAVSFGLAFLFAIVFVVVFTSSLPSGDGAHGQMPFQDPLVLPIMSMFATVAGAIVCIPTCFALRRVRLLHATFILAATVLAEIVVVTPLAGFGGFLGSFPAYALGLILARRLAPA